MGLLHHNDNTTTGDHHVGRDAALGGIVGHHEGSKHGQGHGFRDGVVGAGVVGETQHLRNEHEARHAGLHNPGVAGTGATAGVAPGYGQHTTTAAGGLTAGAAPTSGMTHNTPGQIPTVRQGEKLEKKGELQYKIGHALHAHGMEAKGAAKVHEGQAIQQQGAEIAHAQTLEHEANLRRDRAVGLGASPEHGALGHHGHHHLGGTGVTGSTTTY